MLLLDVKMLGLGVLKWARQRGQLNWLTIVMRSGSANEADTRTAARLGADHHLVKHPPPEILAQIVGAIC